MDSVKHIQLLQMVYAGALADATFQYGQEGVLQQVTARKRQEQLATGQKKAAQFGATTPEAVFTNLSGLFGCVAWQLVPQAEGFSAEASSCVLCALAKKMGAPQPCRLFCLDPMEGMVKGLQPDARFDVAETLWEGQKCRVTVTSE